ncbi:MAG: RsmE family RNA methyltransferase [Bellilinea sp.]
MHRFFLPDHAFQGDEIVFPVEPARQILRVLRLRIGEKVAALDNLGWEFRVELVEINAARVKGRILGKQPVSGEPPVHLHMFLCLSQREKFEWMLQKCTEAGAAEFTPVLSSRALVQDFPALENKYQRWSRIIQEAAEQSGRGRIPQLNGPVKYDAAVGQATANSIICLLAWENEKTLRLADALIGQKPGAAVSLLIGPEGGLSDEEAELAVRLGWRPVSLGRGILRMETAALVAAALTVDWFEANSG